MRPRMIDGRIEILEKLTMDFVEHKRREHEGVSLEDLDDAATYRICFVLGVFVGAGCVGSRRCRLLAVVDLDQLAHLGYGPLALDVVACQRFRIGRGGKPVDSLQSGGCAPILRARFWTGWLAQRLIGEISGVFCGHRISNDAVNADVARLYPTLPRTLFRYARYSSVAIMHAFILWLKSAGMFPVARLLDGLLAFI